MSFTYVKIPAHAESPIEELTASKEGGLENDELVAKARAYFQHLNPNSSCDIMALTIPTPNNHYQAVSLYSSDDSSSQEPNERATQLVTACGHALPNPIRGDVFVGRAHDNEATDIWQRIDFIKDDADATAEWCRIARSSGGGGGHGTKAASSLSGIAQQYMNNPQMVAPPASATTSNLYGMDGAAAVEEDWGKWTQTSEEVELKFQIPANVKPKIVFKRNQLRVEVGSETKLEGTLFQPIVPDECTYTMETVGDHKEVSVTLTKAEEGTTWSWLTMKK